MNRIDKRQAAAEDEIQAATRIGFGARDAALWKKCVGSSRPRFMVDKSNSPDTSRALLQNLAVGDDPVAWTRLIVIYQPLLRRWLRQYDVQESDVEDLIQQVLLALVTELRRFQHSGQAGAFRAWLRMILVHRLRNLWRTRHGMAPCAETHPAWQRLAELEDPDSQLTRKWNQEHDQHLVSLMLDRIRIDFEPRTIEAFERYVLRERDVDQVAEELGITVNAVFIAKSRVLRALRSKFAEFVGSDQLDNDDDAIRHEGRPKPSQPEAL